MSRRNDEVLRLAVPSPKHLPKGERRRRVLELLAKGALRAAARPAGPRPVAPNSKSDAWPGGSDDLG